jgi:hypothetical protein
MKYANNECGKMKTACVQELSEFSFSRADLPTWNPIIDLPNIKLFTKYILPIA